ncbi:MAG: Co2+/Mg2+ efflux protein ApaG [Saprospiraceae bacterium]
MRSIEYQMVTNGISVKVTPKYEDAHSKPSIGKFTFSYHVVIQNLTAEPVKLLSRHWFIYDSKQIQREVEGDGVVGLQPVIKSGEIFEYTSWCPLQSGLGKMHGHYKFIEMSDMSHKFQVEIPEFILVASFVLN